MGSKRRSNLVKEFLHANYPVLIVVASRSWPFRSSPPRRIAAQPDVVRIQKKLDAEIASLLALYKQIHAYPELAFQEEQTAARLAKELRQVGFDVTEKVGGTGIVNVFKNDARTHHLGPRHGRLARSSSRPAYLI